MCFTGGNAVCLTLSITFKWDCYWTKNFCKNLSWFWTWSKPLPASKRLQYNNILFTLQWSKSWELYQLSEHAVTSLVKEWAPAPCQQSSLRFDDTEPSWAVQRKQTSAVRVILSPCPVQDFSHRLEQGKRDGLCQRAAPEASVPFIFNCYLLINRFSKLDFCLQEVSTTGTYEFLKITVFNMTQTRAWMCYWFCPDWFLTDSNKFTL